VEQALAERTEVVLALRTARAVLCRQCARRALAQRALTQLLIGTEFPSFALEQIMCGLSEGSLVP
jgi:hypothetical protein